MSRAVQKFWSTNLQWLNWAMSELTLQDQSKNLSQTSANLLLWISLVSIRDTGVLRIDSSQRIAYAFKHCEAEYRKIKWRWSKMAHGVKRLDKCQISLISTIQRFLEEISSTKISSNFSILMRTYICTTCTVRDVVTKICKPLIVPHSGRQIVLGARASKCVIPINVDMLK